MHEAEAQRRRRLHNQERRAGAEPAQISLRSSVRLEPEGPAPGTRGRASHAGARLLRLRSRARLRQGGGDARQGTSDGSLRVQVPLQRDQVRRRRHPGEHDRPGAVREHVRSHRQEVRLVSSDVRHRACSVSSHDTSRVILLYEQTGQVHAAV